MKGRKKGKDCPSHAFQFIIVARQYIILWFPTSSHYVHWSYTLNNTELTHEFEIYIYIFVILSLIIYSLSDDKTKRTKGKMATITKHMRLEVENEARNSHDLHTIVPSALHSRESNWCHFQKRDATRRTRRRRRRRRERTNKQIQRGDVTIAKWMESGWKKEWKKIKEVTVAKGGNEIEHLCENNWYGFRQQIR